MRARLALCGAALVIEGCAADLDARVEGAIGSEEQLVDALENGTLDVAGALERYLDEELS